MYSWFHKMDVPVGRIHGESDSSLLPVPIEEGAPVNEIGSVSDTDLEVNNSACMNADNFQNTNRSFIPEASIDMKPRRGMEFATLEDVYDFYSNYAQHCGFSVRKDRIIKVKIGKIYRRMLRCCTAGEQQQKVLNLENRKKRARSVTHFICPANIIVDLNPDINRYEIVEFVDSHNHTLCTPAKELNLIANSKSAGISVARLTDFATAELGGHSNLGYLEKDVRNASRRSQQADDGDVDALLSFFQMKIANDSQFTYQMQADKDGHLMSCFWVDRQSKIDYKAFSDVVCFDKTYKTNKYNMPFGSFFGINHHMTTALFGAGFLSGNTASDFKWLFQSWLDAMGGVHPKTIITDKDVAIKEAVAEVFPHTHHILCLWHINKEFPAKLSRICKKHPTFKAAWNHCLYGTESIQEYESSWLKMIEEFKLEDNSWLQEMYAIRKMWIPSYTKCIFTAGMRSTGRIASVNAMFNGFLNHESSLLDFANGYEKAVERRREDEDQAEFSTLYGIPVLKTKLKIEAEMARVCTLNVFRAFQKVVEESLYYHAELLGKEGITEKWHVFCEFDEKVGNHDDKKKYITWNVDDMIACCSCLNFEFCGIVCKHILALFRYKRILSMPPKHILDRWRKSAKRAIMQYVSSAPRSTEDPLILC